MNKTKKEKLINAGENYLKFAVERNYGAETVNKFRKQRNKMMKNDNPKKNAR